MNMLSFSNKEEFIAFDNSLVTTEESFLKIHQTLFLLNIPGFSSRPLAQAAKTSKARFSVGYVQCFEQKSYIMTFSENKF